jgi:hypothetical protein
MKDPDFNLKAEQLLTQFEESIGEIPNATWNAHLMQKISNSSQQTSVGITSKKIGIIALLFILLNIGFCIKTFTKQTTTDVSRSTEFTTISNELLIQNTTSTN